MNKYTCPSVHYQFKYISHSALPFKSNVFVGIKYNFQHKVAMATNPINTHTKMLPIQCFELSENCQQYQLFTLYYSTISLTFLRPTMYILYCNRHHWYINTKFLDEENTYLLVSNYIFSVCVYTRPFIAIH